MTPFNILQMRNPSSGGGGITWGDIVRTSNPPVVGANADQTMTGTGMLNLSYSGSASWSVFKNGISQGQVGSISVAPGHTVHFQFSSSVNDSGVMSITGLVTDSFNVSLNTLS